MNQITRRNILQTAGVAGVIGIAGCVGDFSGGTDREAIDAGDSGAPTGDADTTVNSTPSQTPGPPPDPNPPTADDPLDLQHPFEKLTKETQSGGPGKDGIPSIDDPIFLSAAEGDKMLDPGDIVFGYAGESDIKAYPQHIVVWHEIVNDTLDGKNTSVTYCPLTGTVLGFERGDIEFGVSGNLVNNNLIMYDRNTDTRWPQILGTAIKGPFKGHSLREFRVVWTTWEHWKAQHPDTQVLSEDTGSARNYDRDPYGEYNPKSGYYADKKMLFPPLHDDDRFQAKRIVMGARTSAGATAFLKDSLRDQGVMDGGIGGTAVTAVYDGRFDTGYVYRNPEEESISRMGTQAVIDGESYAPDALPLQRVHTFDTMWFAWSGFYPQTEVYQ